MISHFGMKPVRGGRPPRESRTRGVRAVSIGALDQDVAKALRLVALFSLNVKNVEKVITKYVISVRKLSAGENCSTMVSQPRCAIDE